MQSEIYIEGPLKLYTAATFGKKWRTHHFRLIPGFLVVLKKKTDRAPEGTVAVKYIDRIQLIQEGDSAALRINVILNHSFSSITNTSGKLVLLASTEKECEAWVEAFQRLLNVKTTTISKPLESPTTYSALSTPTRRNSIFDTSSPSHTSPLSPQPISDESARAFAVSLSLTSFYQAVEVGRIYLARSYLRKGHIYYVHIVSESDISSSYTQTSVQAMFEAMSRLCFPYHIKQVIKGDSAGSTWAVYGPFCPPEHSLASQLQLQTNFELEAAKTVIAMAALLVSHLHGQGYACGSGFNTTNLCFDNENRLVWIHFSHCFHNLTSVTQAEDWKNFGLLAYELLTGSRPSATQPFALPPSLSTECQSLLYVLLAPGVDSKISFISRLVPHPFYQGFDWEKLQRRYHAGLWSPSFMEQKLPSNQLPSSSSISSAGESVLADNGCRSHFSQDVVTIQLVGDLHEVRGLTVSECFCQFAIDNIPTPPFTATLPSSPLGLSPRSTSDSGNSVRMKFADTPTHALLSPVAAPPDSFGLTVLHTTEPKKINSSGYVQWEERFAADVTALAVPDRAGSVPLALCDEPNGFAVSDFSFRGLAHSCLVARIFQPNKIRNKHEPPATIARVEIPLELIISQAPTPLEAWWSTFSFNGIPQPIEMNMSFCLQVLRQPAASTFGYSTQTSDESPPWIHFAPLTVYDVLGRGFEGGWSLGSDNKSDDDWRLGSITRRETAVVGRKRGIQVDEPISPRRLHSISGIQPVLQSAPQVVSNQLVLAEIGYWNGETDTMYGQHTNTTANITTPAPRSYTHCCSCCPCLWQLPSDSYETFLQLAKLAQKEETTMHVKVYDFREDRERSSSHTHCQLESHSVSVISCYKFSRKFPPPFGVLLRISIDLYSFLHASSSHVALFACPLKQDNPSSPDFTNICALLILSAFFLLSKSHTTLKSAIISALEFSSIKGTSFTPCQTKYLQYFEQFLQDYQLFAPASTNRFQLYRSALRPLVLASPLRLLHARLSMGGGGGTWLTKIARDGVFLAASGCSPLSNAHFAVTSYTATPYNGGVALDWIIPVEYYLDGDVHLCCWRRPNVTRGTRSASFVPPTLNRQRASGKIAQSKVEELALKKDQLKKSIKAASGSERTRLEQELDIMRKTLNMLIEIQLQLAKHDLETEDAKTKITPSTRQLLVVDDSDEDGVVVFDFWMHSYMVVRSISEIGSFCVTREGCDRSVNYPFLFTLTFEV